MRYNPCTVTSFFLLLALLQVSPESIRERMTALIGGLPEVKTPLNERTISTFERPGYRVEKVVFESLPGFRVTANLYVPTTGQGPFPAVLGTAGHSDNGKAHEVYQAMWISLARRGYVVLAYDPPGQGERLEYFDPELGRSRIGAGVREHNAAGMQALLTGAPIARYFIWDGIRAFDYLLTRREVDAAKIAVAGNSGGGTQAAYLAVFEPRLAAVVSSCYMTTWKELMAGPGPQDAEQIIPGFLAAGFDFADFARAFAPKPFLITSATRDYFPIAGARETAATAGPNVSFFEFDDTHGWSQPRREAAQAFLDRHLKGVSGDVKEEPMDTEPESALWVTPTGQLANSFGTETVFSINAAVARQVYPNRKAATMKDPEELRALIRKRLGLGETKPAAIKAHVGKPAVLAAGLPAADVADLRRVGFVVREVREPKREAGKGGYAGTYQDAAKEWLYGRTTLGWRVAEMLAGFRELAADADVDPLNITVWGKGHGGVAAMLAAALEPRIAKVLAEGSVVSWFAITQGRLFDDIAEIVVPGVLKDFDLPDLVPLIAPRPFLLGDPRTATGARVAPQALRTVYPAAVVGAVERPGGWAATKVYGPWLMAPRGR